MNLTYYQKVVALCLLAVEARNSISRLSAMQTFSHACGMFPISPELSGVFDDLRDSYRLANSEVFYFDGETMWLVEAERITRVSESFSKSCSPAKQDLLRRVRETFE